MAKEEQIKTSIDLTGEKEYRAACTNINSSLREIGSEMKLTTAEFADNADSVEALTAKQKLLQKQFDEQAKKAEAAEKALKKMRDNGIEPTNPAYQKMQTNLNNTKADMVKIQKEIDDTSKKLKSSKVDWESVGETVGKAGKAIGAACAAMGAAIAAAGAAFFGLAEETREARENMGKLETSFTTAGHSAEDAKNTYTELYGVLGDDGQATEAAAHLAKLTTNEKELSDWTNICTGVYATFGDSLPIEGLTEAANETAKTGSITGNLADALNWAGVSEDDFQASLDACTSEQERQALITSTLNGLYSEAADKYTMSPYNTFEVYEPKRRVVMSNSYKDKVVQHSLCDNVLEPILTRSFIRDNYASQVGKGTHYGLDRLQEFMRRFYRKNGIDGWILKGDISKYFYSIRHDVLKTLIREKITDPDVLWLVDLIIDSTEGNVGIPIGNQTSQLFALIYLDGLDHFVKEKLGIKYYGRYMDDFFLIHHDKAYLQECRKQIEAFVQARGLSLNAKTNIFPLKHGVDFLGFHTYLTESGAVIRKVRRRSKNNMKRKLKKLAALHAAGRIDAKTVEQSYQSWRGHAEKGNSYHLIRRTDQYYNSLMKSKEAAQCQKH